MNIGFVGLGTMGLPMARNILEGGHRVIGFDLDSAARRRHHANGGEVAGSAAEAARGADLVVTMVPEARHVRDALLGPNGVIEGLQEGALVVEMSTIHPLETDAIRAELAGRGFAMVDAPVGRTAQHAREGRLLIMAGGEPADLRRCHPLFECVGEVTVDCGGPGRGSRMKIVNNFMSTALNVLTAEALTLAEASGLDIGLTIDVLSGTAAGKGHFQTTYPAKVLAGDLDPDFMLRLAHKDLALAIDLGCRLGADSLLGPVALEIYRAAIDRDRGTQDWTAVYPFIRERAGLDGD
ncbi:MAG: sulfolactaldehyde 3-reductase [Truepera sp.]|nr:sulfolactaldehyde 3-reductase [Truepera sp.]